MFDPPALWERAAGWFTSSYSNANGTCVQVRFVGGDVEVADSKDGGRGR